MIMKDSIVLFPALGRGHLISMVELGKLILTHNPSFSITIFILTPPPSSTTTHGCHDSTAKYIAAISAAVPSIAFHHIPNDQQIPHALNSVSQTSNLKALVIDFLNYNALKVINALDIHIPTYFYYTSGASTLAIFLQVPIIHENTTRSLRDLNTYLRIPGLPRIHTSDFPDPVMDRTSHGYKVFLDIGKRMRVCDGIIVNTFDAIEERAIRALCSRAELPPVFCIGPLVSAQCEKDESGCLSWLDSQPSQSVVLLSFGSLGKFSRNQIKEIAVGLEKSEQRFLWVVRSESDGSDSEASLDELLPEGFLERTKERGLVVKNWAPQAAILSHDSVGGFVTHCGWNSVLEAVCEGVPMVTWPLYAEQKLNRVILVQEMKVALALNESRDGLVSGNELGDRVKELMDSDKGKEIRQRVFKMKIGAIEAMAEGGTSLVALKRLTESWRKH